MGAPPETQTWPKRCACGLTWTRETWRELHLVGRWDVYERSVEMRTCSCGSTLTIPTGNEPRHE